MNVEKVAQIAHETNRAYCQSIGDNSQPLWENAPEWQKDSARNGVQFHISQLDVGIKPAPSASHESWLKQKADEGWKFGAIKNADTKEHPCFVPYDELPLEQRMKDYLFAHVVLAFWEADNA